MERHHRRSVRLRNHAYTHGSYFLTICTEEREWLFGKICNGIMELNVLGKVVEEEWMNTEHLRPYIHLDAYVVMPNHFHAIVHLSGNSPCRVTARCDPTNLGSRALINPGTRAPTAADRSFQSAIPQSLSTIIRAFKSAVTRRINLHRGESGAKVWQRNFHEHIVRNAAELAAYRIYIRDNPETWKRDQEYFIHDPKGHGA